MITKKIHQIWLGTEPLPAAFASWAETWRAHHPEWTYKLWSDVDAARFPLYRALAPLCVGMASKANLLRLLILESEGGMYADTDAECLGNFESVINRDTTGCILCACGSDWNTPEHPWNLKVNNAWLYAAARSTQLHAMVALLRKSYFTKILSLTISGDWIARVAEKNGGVTVHSHELTNPNAPWEPVPDPLPTGCLSIHHWEGSWIPDANRTKLGLGPRKVAAPAAH